MAAWEHTSRDLEGGRANRQTLRERVSVVCIQCEQTEGGKKKIMLSQINRAKREGVGGQPVRGDMSLEKIRTETQIKLKNMVVQHRTGKWLNG